MFTELKGRQLWYDGDTVVPQQDILNFIQRGVTRNLCVSEMTSDVVEYNKYARPNEKIRTKSEIRPLDLAWDLPDHYQTLDVKGHLMDMFTTQAVHEHWSDTEVHDRLARMLHELEVYTRGNMINILQTIVYIVDVLQRDNIPWGIGRGSSVSSYVLYLIGIHDVDSYKYDLDFSEFVSF